MNGYYLLELDLLKYSFFSTRYYLNELNKLSPKQICSVVKNIQTIIIIITFCYIDIKIIYKIYCNVLTIHTLCALFNCI